MPKFDEQRFVLEGELGKGGMGLVLRVHDQLLDRHLAMKVLLERPSPRDEDERRLASQLLGRFLEEAQVTSQLDHPGVVPVHELGLDQTGKVYFTMRMVKGRTASEAFADAFHHRGEWDLTRALEVILKVCDTMAYAHDKGVLHRDLKPGNVMVGRFGEVYVMDWGLAKVLGQPDLHDLRVRTGAADEESRLRTARMIDAASDSASSVVSMDGQQLGTPCYMSPEQARGEPLDARADVYAIGAMMYELTTGSPPYWEPGARLPAHRILQHVVAGEPKRIEESAKGVPASLVAVIDKAMARDRERRYRGVQELAADVRAFLAQRVVTAYRTGAWQEAKLWVRRNKPLAASLAAAAALMAAATAIAVTFGAAEARARQSAAEQQRIAERNADDATKARNQAQDNERRAVAAQSEADAKAKALAAKVADFDRLSLVVDHERLLAEAPRFAIPYPEQIGAIDDWSQRASRLLAGKDELAAALASARRNATGPDGPASAASGFLAKSLGSLLERLPDLDAALAAMQSRRQWATALRALTFAHPRAKVTWDAARAAIAANPKYSGQDIPLRDEDVWGLVPIGENPQSGLWEFYDLRSAWDGEGDPMRIGELPVPVHGPDGRVPVDAGSGVVWVLLPGGSLPPGTVDQNNEDGTSARLRVRLDPFLIAKHEVTHGQWQRWTGKPPRQRSNGETDLSFPVATVSWIESTTVLRTLDLDLPTELQWEYAIRGGTATRWWTGDDLAEVVRLEMTPTDLQAVGRRAPNPFGLHDMASNVSEWCRDEDGDYGTERNGDGMRPERENAPTTQRVHRGGNSLATDVTQAVAEESGFRGDGVPAYMQEEVDTLLGLRPVRRIRLRP